jgi:aryl-alcohol dehydrogenase-like predicted oxidoreductase
VNWSSLDGTSTTWRQRPDGACPQADSRLRSQVVVDLGPPVDDETLYKVVDALDAVAAETGKTVPQVALNWLLQRPSVATLIIGARNEEQLRQNLGAVGWNLTWDQVARLDAASAITPAYPYWHQKGFAERNPPAV